MHVLAPVRIAATFALLLQLAGSATAQIYIGQTAGFSGPAAVGVKESAAGAKLYFDKVNMNGGINGQQIELVSLDDKFDPTLAAQNAKKLIVDRKVIALFLTRGTPHTEAILPVLKEFAVPLVAPSTGAMVLHRPANPYVFNVRAPYQRESDKAVEHLVTIGITRIGLIQTEDSFGADAVQGAIKGLDRAGLKPLFLEKFDRAKPDLAKITLMVTQHSPQAVIFIGSASTVAEGIKALRRAGSKSQVVTLSNNASAGFVKQLGTDGVGVVVTQVFPAERSISVPMVKEALDQAGAKGLSEISPSTLEGFAAAKVLVEGLRRAGSNPTSLKLIAALNGLRKLDIGGLEVSFSADHHTGLGYTELSIIGSDGRFHR